MLRRLAAGGRLTLTAVVVLSLVVALASVPIGQAAHQDDPRFTAYVQTPTIQPGGTAEVTVLLENDGETVADTAATARQVRATMRSGGTPITVVSGTQAVEPIPDGAASAVTFTIRVPRDIDAGEYTLPIDVAHEFTSHGVRQNGNYTVRPTFEVEDSARFAVVESESDVSVGDEGTFNVTVENVGSATATDGTMTLTSNSAAVTVGGAEADNRYVGQLAPGERRSVAYEVAVAESAEAQPLALSATVNYDDEDGLARSSAPLTVELRPSDEQEFSVRGVESTLRVGTEGTIRGEVVNDGPATVENAVAVLSTASQNLVPTETEYVIGTLEPGEAASFEYEVETSEAASGGMRQLTMQVRYRNGQGAQRQAEPIDVDVEVAPDRDVFDVQPRNATIEAGGNGRLVLEVTNAGEEPVTDVSAKLFANDPISSANDEAFAPEIAPGETERMVFDISGAPGVIPKTYPVSVDFQYDDAEGDTLLSDTYRVPVTVVEPESGGGPPILPIVVVLVVVLGGGYYLLRRRGRWPPWG